MKSIEQLETEMQNERATVRENKAKSLITIIGEMISNRKAWMSRRQEEIDELIDLDHKMRNGYLAANNATLDAVRTEIDQFDEKNKGRSRRNYGHS